MGLHKLIDEYVFLGMFKLSSKYTSIEHKIEEMHKAKQRKKQSTLVRQKSILTLTKIYNKLFA